MQIAPYSTHESASMEGVIKFSFPSKKIKTLFFPRLIKNMYRIELGAIFFYIKKILLFFI